MCVEGVVRPGSIIFGGSLCVRERKMGYQTGELESVSMGEAICIPVVDSHLVFHLEVEVPQREEPPGHHGIRVLGPGYPMQGLVVSDESEVAPSQVVPELFFGPLHWQGFPLHSGILPLSGG